MAAGDAELRYVVVVFTGDVAELRTAMKRGTYSGRETRERKSRSLKRSIADYGTIPKDIAAILLPSIAYLVTCTV